MDSNLMGTANDDVVGVLRTILLFLESQNLKETSAALKQEAEKLGHGNVQCIMPKVIVLKPALAEVHCIPVSKSNQADFPIDTTKSYILESSIYEINGEEKKALNFIECGKQASGNNLCLCCEKSVADVRTLPQIDQVTSISQLPCCIKYAAQIYHNLMKDTPSYDPKFFNKPDFLKHRQCICDVCYTHYTRDEKVQNVVQFDDENQKLSNSPKEEIENAEKIKVSEPPKKTKLIEEEEKIAANLDDLPQMERVNKRDKNFKPERFLKQLELEKKNEYLQLKELITAEEIDSIASTIKEMDCEEIQLAYAKLQDEYTKLEGTTQMMKMLLENETDNLTINSALDDLKETNPIVFTDEGVADKLRVRVKNKQIILTDKTKPKNVRRNSKTASIKSKSSTKDETMSVASSIADSAKIVLKPEQKDADADAGSKIETEIENVSPKPKATPKSAKKKKGITESKDSKLNKTSEKKAIDEPSVNLTADSEKNTTTDNVSMEATPDKNADEVSMEVTSISHTLDSGESILLQMKACTGPCLENLEKMDADGANTINEKFKKAIDIKKQDNVVECNVSCPFACENIDCIISDACGKSQKVEIDLNLSPTDVTVIKQLEEQLAELKEQEIAELQEKKKTSSKKSAKKNEKKAIEKKEIKKTGTESKKVIDKPKRKSSLSSDNSLGDKTKMKKSPRSSKTSSIEKSEVDKLFVEKTEIKESSRTSETISIEKGELKELSYTSDTASIEKNEIEKSSLSDKLSADNTEIEKSSGTSETSSIKNTEVEKLSVPDISSADKTETIKSPQTCKRLETNVTDMSEMSMDMGDENIIKTLEEKMKNCPGICYEKYVNLDPENKLTPGKKLRLINKIRKQCNNVLSNCPETCEYLLCNEISSKFDKRKSVVYDQIVTIIADDTARIIDEAHKDLLQTMQKCGGSCYDEMKKLDPENQMSNAEILEKLAEIRKANLEECKTKECPEACVHFTCKHCDILDTLTHEEHSSSVGKVIRVSEAVMDKLKETSIEPETLDCLTIAEKCKGPCFEEMQKLYPDKTLTTDEKICKIHEIRTENMEKYDKDIKCPEACPLFLCKHFKSLDEQFTKYFEKVKNKSLDATSENVVLADVIPKDLQNAWKEMDECYYQCSDHILNLSQTVISAEDLLEKVEKEVEEDENVCDHLKKIISGIIDISPLLSYFFKNKNKKKDSSSTCIPLKKVAAEDFNKIFNKCKNNDDECPLCQDVIAGIPSEGKTAQDIVEDIKIIQMAAEELNESCPDACKHLQCVDPSQLGQMSNECKKCQDILESISTDGKTISDIVLAVKNLQTSIEQLPPYCSSDICSKLACVDLNDLKTQLQVLEAKAKEELKKSQHTCDNETCNKCLTIINQILQDKETASQTIASIERIKQENVNTTNVCPEACETLTCIDSKVIQSELLGEERILGVILEEEDEANKSRRAKKSPYFDLDYRKLKKSLIECDDWTKMLLLQALRWRITKSTPENRDVVVSAYIRNDLLGLHSDPCRPYFKNLLECYYCTPPSQFANILQESIARLVNSFASLTIGRDYLSVNDDLLIYILLPLFLGRHPSKTKISSLTMEHVLATLQKLSLRKKQRVLMINSGLVEFLILFLSENHDKVSSYCLEYSTTLLMNLCLHKETRLKCRSSASTVVELFKALLGTKHKCALPYVNGAIYSLLTDKYINKEARNLKLGDTIQYYIARMDGEIKDQLKFIYKMHKENLDGIECLCDSNAEPDEEVDLLEPELEANDPVDGVPNGEEILKFYKLSKAKPKISCLCRPITPLNKNFGILQETCFPSTCEEKHDESEATCVETQGKIRTVDKEPMKRDIERKKRYQELKVNKMETKKIKQSILNTAQELAADIESGAVDYLENSGNLPSIDEQNETALMDEYSILSQNIPERESVDETYKPLETRLSAVKEEELDPNECECVSGNVDEGSQTEVENNSLKIDPKACPPNLEERRRTESFSDKSTTIDDFPKLNKRKQRNKDKLKAFTPTSKADSSSLRKEQPNQLIEPVLPSTFKETPRYNKIHDKFSYLEGIYNKPRKMYHENNKVIPVPELKTPNSETVSCEDDREYSEMLKTTCYLPTCNSLFCEEKLLKYRPRKYFKGEMPSTSDKKEDDTRCPRIVGIETSRIPTGKFYYLPDPVPYFPNYCCKTREPRERKYSCDCYELMKSYVDESLKNVGKCSKNSPSTSCRRCN